MAFPRCLRIALFALALLALGSHAEFGEDEEAVDVQAAEEAVDVQAAEEAVDVQAAEDDEEEPNPLTNAVQWWKGEKGQKLMKSFFKSSFPFVEFMGWLAHMDDEDFAAFKDLSTTVVGTTQEVLKIVRTAKDFVDPKRVHKLGPIAEGINHILFKDPNAPPPAKVDRTAMKEAAQQSREEAKQARMEARLPENRAKAKEAAQAQREQMKTERKQQALDAKESRKRELIEQKEQAARARIEAQQQKVEERLQKAEERQQKALAREAAKQTPEELQREVLTRDSLHHTIKALVGKVVSYLHMNSTAGLLSLPIESEVIPPIMKMRRSGGKENRALVDTLANISVDDIVESSNFFGALYAKSQEVVQVLSDAGHDRPAEVLNVTMPIFNLVKDVGQVFGGAEWINTARFSRLLSSLVELPQLEGIELLDKYRVREHASVLARLLEAGSHRRAPAKRILASLGLDYEGDVAPMLADAIFFILDVKGGMNDQAGSVIFDDAANMLSYMPGDEAKKSLMACLKFGKDVVKLGMHANQTDAKALAHTIVSISAGLINTLDFMSEPIIRETTDMMRWTLIFVCNMRGLPAERSFCKDYKSKMGVQTFSKASAQSFSAKNVAPKTTKTHKAPSRKGSAKLRGTKAHVHSLKVKKGAKDALTDTTILVQRTVAVRRSKPRAPQFPAKKMMRWAENEFPEEFEKMQSTINLVNRLQQVFSPEHIKLAKTFMHGIKMFKQGQKQLQQMKEAQKAAEKKRSEKTVERQEKRAERQEKRAGRQEMQASGNESDAELNRLAREQKKKKEREEAKEAAKEAASEARKAARSGPPPKQTPEEREREKISRTKITNDFDHLMEEFLTLPAFARKGIEALIVPEIMQFRKKGGHKTRMLVDEIANISFNVASKEELPGKAMEVVEAVKGAGYEQFSRTVDWFKDHGGAMMQLAQEFRGAADELEKTGSLNMDQTSRLLHLATKLDLGQHVKFMLNHFIGIIDANKATVGDNSTKVMATLVQGVAETDKTEAKLLEDVVRLLQMTAKFGTSPGQYLKQYTRWTTLRNLVQRMAAISIDMGEWRHLNLTKTKRTLFTMSGKLMQMMADYREGHEVEIAIKLAGIAEVSPEIGRSVLTVMDEFMSFICQLRGTEENLSGCKDLREAAEEPLPAAPIIPLAQAQ